jgi:D-serine deaminase-like pyridoxal phosphate-dependent protein
MPQWFEISNASEVPSPALLVYPDRIAQNLRRMVEMAGGAQHLRPHVKTHKMAEIVAMKLDAGIDKFKASTIAEAEMVAEAGGRDVLLAYPLVGPNIARLLELIDRFPDTTFSALVDDPEVLSKISASAVKAGKTVNLFIDLDVGMGRTGIVPGAAALDLYRKMANSPGISAVGFHAYDGHLHDDNVDRLRQSVAATFAPVWQMRSELSRSGISVPTVIAGGTPTSMILASAAMVPDDCQLEVGAGTSVLWDAGQPHISPGIDFLNAAVLLIRVVSRPAQHKLCLDLGHKGVASEFPHPRIRIFGLEEAIPLLHSEEHLVVESPRADQYPPGTVCYGIPYHICPTVALYDHVWSVRDGRAEQRWEVVARRRQLTI